MWKLDIGSFNYWRFSMFQNKPQAQFLLHVTYNYAHFMSGHVKSGRSLEIHRTQKAESAVWLSGNNIIWLLTDLAWYNSHAMFTFWSW